ncbi:MAG: hypothetical protein WBM71_20010 [Sedimenticolaceae bacterium]|jgi:hypothetical protein
MHFIKNSLHCFHAALLAGMVLGVPSASAASQCQGIAQDQCASQAACTWVNGYVRKDGRSVSSHCKARGGKKSANQADADALKASAADKS